MVKLLYIRLCILLFLGGCFLISCNIDFLGFFMSSDLDDRLKTANTFVFLEHTDLNTNFGDEYSFIVITDTHISNRNAYGLERLKDVITENDIEFVAIVGDITDGGRREDIEKLIEIARSFDVPTYPIIGNHDIYFNNWANWRDLIGSTRYRVNGGGTTLFILDSANSFFGKNQLDWLEMQLKTTIGNRVFVFSHVNLFIDRPVGVPMLTDVRERARIISILRGHCDIMFMGHSHENLIRETGGIIFLSINSFKNSSSYCIVSVTKENISYRLEKL